eukprot:CAMPEP_0172440770 /NCGR_PEP_ID=MMETSP1065-20121228/1381_1 /TAXON_ID=265537 /ORGANISM="Amphiprora paludosa, Strain CCMP125" /LENGTH=517 /DNA_ID=CAMNT_0013189781 /DNA_START=103 /DNA_END=1656 /DNA_ORIENTATION=-
MTKLSEGGSFDNFDYSTMSDTVADSSELASGAPTNPTGVSDEPELDEPSFDSSSNSINLAQAKRVEWNFRLMTMLFGANHGCVVSCLSLATARFAAVGAWQSGILYLTYTGSAIFGATWVVKQFGGRDALMAGMALYCVYVAAFLAATIYPEQQRLIAYMGAGVGGTGAGFLWTAQGSYFATAAEHHAKALGQPLEQSTNAFGSTFAFYYLALEVILRAISSLSGSVQFISWTVIFTIYFLVAVLTTVGMLFVEKLKEPSTETNLTSLGPSSSTESSWWYRATVTLQLLWREPKMKYMIGLNSVFGFSSAFLNSYVNGEVVDVVFDRDNVIGILTAGQAILAAILSMVFARVADRYGKGTVLILGSIAFAFVAIPFVLYPTTAHWTPFFLFFVYAMQGTGRATFEGTLKAVFADFFQSEKEGAFANIIFQNGSATALGYALSSGFNCNHKESRYCIEFHDGTLHNLVPFEWLVIGSAVIAILGYLVASSLHAESIDKDFVPVPQEDEEEEEEQRNVV